jgi:hypothetical protein
VHQVLYSSRYSLNRFNSAKNPPRIFSFFFRDHARARLDPDLDPPNKNFGSGSRLDPDSIRPVDPESGSGSRRAEVTHKNRKKLINFMFLRKKSRNFMFLSAGGSLLKAEGFCCNLDVLYEGPGISKLQFFFINKYNFFSSCNFFSLPIFGYKTLDPDPVWYQLKMMDPDSS